MPLKAAYATYTDYWLWKHGVALPDGTTPPSSFASDIRRASRNVDDLVASQSYETTSLGMPVEPDILATLCEAACANYEYAQETGDPAGAGDYAGVRTDIYGPETIAVLRRGGLRNSSVSHA